ncbi:Vps51p [Trichuris trichiura]|uniref:Vps51p n=1 Tax=Trichuris trichiura TaxID=36087 RepID=A0A077ZL42_TRITR|nr:Vps51p [Trichuris trichiura]
MSDIPDQFKKTLLIGSPDDNLGVNLAEEKNAVSVAGVPEKCEHPQASNAQSITFEEMFADHEDCKIGTEGNTALIDSLPSDVRLHARAGLGKDTDTNSSIFGSFFAFVMFTTVFFFSLWKFSQQPEMLVLILVCWIWLHRLY